MPALLPKSFDKRYLAPILVTMVLIVGQVTFGFLESWGRTFLAIATSIAVEMLLGRMIVGKWPHLASAYISGISIGMLLRSPEIWPYALCAAISIVSKYVLRVDGRHIWNPSNFGIVAMLVLASDTVASLSVQWGNNLLPMAEAAPLTGPMYQLYIFFMITDPKTTVHPTWAQCLVAFLVAAVEAALRLMQFVHAPYYALFIVGPIANLIEIALTRAASRQAVPAAAPAPSH
jgi:hypothetical protein